MLNGIRSWPEEGEFFLGGWAGMSLWDTPRVVTMNWSRELLRSHVWIDRGRLVLVTDPSDGFDLICLASRSSTIRRDMKSVSSFSMIRDMILLRKLEGILERIDALGGSFFWKNSNR